MNKDKIIPFTEIDNEQMIKFRKEIFTKGFLKIMDSNENKLSDYDREIIDKILNYLLDLIEKQEDNKHKILVD